MRMQVHVHVRSFVDLFFPTQIFVGKKENTTGIDQMATEDILEEIFFQLAHISMTVYKICQ